MVVSAKKEVKEPKPLNLFQRIADRDQTVVKDCLDSYGNIIWSLARNFTSSTEDAEAATQAIFLDIWRYADDKNKIRSSEKSRILQIALRRLIRYRRKSGLKIHGSHRYYEQGQ